MAVTRETSDDALLDSIYRRAGELRLRRSAVLLTPVVAMLLVVAIVSASVSTDGVREVRAGDRGDRGGGDRSSEVRADEGGSGGDADAQDRVDTGGSGGENGDERQAGGQPGAGGADRQAPGGAGGVAQPAGSGSGGVGKGVFSDEIRIAVVASSTVPEGRLERDFRADDSDEERGLKVWQHYFSDPTINGRRLQFYVIHQPAGDAEARRDSIRKADEEFNVFAVVGNTTDAAVEETIRRKLIDFGETARPLDFYAKAFPYAYSLAMDTWQHRYLAAELICKQFGGGRPPGAINERQDPTFNYSAPRKWGIVTVADGSEQVLTTALRQTCGEAPVAVGTYNVTDNQSSIAGITARMRAAGVTTIVLYTDGVVPAVITNEAGRMAYYPEWVAIGGLGIESNRGGRLLADDQAKHTVGVNPFDRARRDTDKEWYREYRSVDPEGEPDRGYYDILKHLSAGLRLAGTSVNTASFWDGLKRYRPRPVQADAPNGAYRDELPGDALSGADTTFYDDATLMWWDGSADAPDSDLPGAWRHVWNGRRFGLTEMPTDPVPWFRDGVV